MAKINSAKLCGHSVKRAMSPKMVGDDGVTYTASIPDVPRVFDMKTWAKCVNAAGVKSVTGKAVIEGVAIPLRFNDVAPAIVVEAIVDAAGRTGKRAEEILGYDPDLPVKPAKAS